MHLSFIRTRTLNNRKMKSRKVDYGFLQHNHFVTGRLLNNSHNI